MNLRTTLTTRKLNKNKAPMPQIVPVIQKSRSTGFFCSIHGTYDENAKLSSGIG